MRIGRSPTSGTALESTLPNIGSEWFRTCVHDYDNTNPTGPDHRFRRSTAPPFLSLKVRANSTSVYCPEGQCKTDTGTERTNLPSWNNGNGSLRIWQYRHLRSLQNPYYFLHSNGNFRKVVWTRQSRSQTARSKFQGMPIMEHEDWTRSNKRELKSSRLLSGSPDIKAWTGPAKNS